jgi:hypothetical protein
VAGRPVYFGGFVQMPTRALTQRYLRGDCGYLALAFHAQMPNSQIWLLGGQHFAVEDSEGRFWDIRGCMTLAQVWNHIGGEAMVPLDRAAVMTELDRGIYGDARFTPSREKQARAVIRAWVPAVPDLGRRPRRPGPRST